VKECEGRKGGEAKKKGGGPRRMEGRWITMEERKEGRRVKEGEGR
jgi:hypothetical protein